MKQATMGLIALCLISVGCGSSSSSGSAASTVAASTSSTPSQTTSSSTAAPTSSATTPQPIVRALSGEHGELVEVATLAGGVTLGFLPDGARYFDYHHTASDTLDKVSPRELNAGAAAIAVLAHAVADAEWTLPRNL